MAAAAGLSAGAHLRFQCRALQHGSRRLQLGPAAGPQRLAPPTAELVPVGAAGRRQCIAACISGATCGQVMNMACLMAALQCWLLDSCCCRAAGWRCTCLMQVADAECR